MALPNPSHKENGTNTDIAGFLYGRNGTEAHLMMSSLYTHLQQPKWTPPK